MYWKRFLLTIVFAGLLISLVGCNMPASTPPASTATSGSGFPVPGTSESMGLFETIATQTAMAAGGQPPVPGNPTAAQPPATSQPNQPGQATQPPASNNPPATNPTSVPVDNQPQPPAPTQAPIVVPTATPGIPQTYTIQKGEYVYCLARRFDVNPADLMAANGLGTSTLLQPGTELNIPQNGNHFPGQRTLHDHPTTYTVNAGDTIFTIACRFGDVDPYLMAELNGIKEPYNLSAGQTIQVP